MTPTAIFFCVSLGTVLLILVVWVVFNVRQHHHLCFAPRRIATDVERGYALSEFPPAGNAATGPLGGGHGATAARGS